MKFALEFFQLPPSYIRISRPDSGCHPPVLWERRRRFDFRQSRLVDATQAATLTLSNPSIVDFGAATAIPTLGNFVLIGAPSTNPQGGFFGAVGAYKKPAAGWASATQNKMFFPPFGSNPETYGSAIAISGSKPGSALAERRRGYRAGLHRPPFLRWPARAPAKNSACTAK
jgi:hypothetical protein